MEPITSHDLKREHKNSVYIATSLDGFIADKDGGLDWLDRVPNPDQIDMGYYAFMERIDALVMGRISFETVLGFDIEWPYSKPVFVLSRTLKEIPSALEGKVFLVNGSIREVLDQLHERGFYRLYIDGGATIRSFLREDLIDEMIITTMPILLGGGPPLFTDLPEKLEFECVGSEVFLGQLVQRHYIRKRSV